MRRCSASPKETQEHDSLTATDEGPHYAPRNMLRAFLLTHTCT